ncbi:MAG: polysaccharide deacetylase family protein [Bacillota bacterium]
MKTQRRGVLGRQMVNILLACLIILLYVATSHPNVQSVMGTLYAGPIYRGQGEGKAALYVAVDWNAAALESILDELQASGTHITFCVGGTWAKDNPELLRRIAADGHEIGTMGMDPGNDGDLPFVMEDLDASVSAIKNGCGVTASFYYSGTRSIPNSTRAAQALGLVHILCTVDLLSARGDETEILARALDQPFDGTILLMQPTAAAARALPQIIAALKQKGLEVVPVGDVVAAGRTG